MSKKPKTIPEFTKDELHQWCLLRILESLMYGRFEEGVRLAVNQAIVWGRKGNH